ncbi:hypothetical protein DPMN_141845 [Dreissena polymorpha]|uniref:Uncharacterized protein n=1 Tax=Dreissena polymorpha TaxID=45954 RepID=A0A9D4GD47_DREPO|nr:hypothetical protein DPMN_141845 [Dreissena polymorpha]
MTTVRQYDDDSATIRWRQCDSTMATMRWCDNTMTTVRQNDDESATIRWRQCNSTAEWVKFLPGTSSPYPGKEMFTQTAWSWRKWKSFIDEHFNALPGIRKYLYFPMSATPGVVMVKTCSNGEETSFCLLKNECFHFTNTDRTRYDSS